MLRDWLRLALDVFSRSPVGQRYPDDRLPEKVRNRILLLCLDVFSGKWVNGWSRPEDLRGAFLGEIYSLLQYAQGRVRLSVSEGRESGHEDAPAFLLSCGAPEFLDFVELIFRTQSVSRVTSDENHLVEAINDIFRSEATPYRLTPFVKEQEHVPSPAGPWSDMTTIRIIAFPKVVRAEDEVTFSEALTPALSTLAAPPFTAANAEFRDALEEYRRGDFGDCLAKCGSAFESVLKVLCERHRLPIGPHDTAAPLLKAVLSRTSLDSFFEQPLILIATMRNRLSSSHGGGRQPRQVPRQIAQYAVTSTAAAIVLLVHEAG